MEAPSQPIVAVLKPRLSSNSNSNSKIITEQKQQQQQRSLNVSVEPRRLVLSFSQPLSTSNGVTQKKRIVPRSAELFSPETFSEETKLQVDKIAAEYSSTLDTNYVTSPLKEIKSLLELISSGASFETCVESPAIVAAGRKLIGIPSKVYFIIKVLSLQLNSTLASIDSSVIKTLVDKYPHRIPKGWRKIFEAWVKDQLTKGHDDSHISSSTRKPSEFHTTVTFQSETDGRSNFGSQTDFHGYCKQRDLFYSIKNEWDQQSVKENAESLSLSTVFGKNVTVVTTTANAFNKPSSKGLSPLITPTSERESKVKSLFAINSSWVNLSHFSALFTAQYINDSMEESRKSATGIQDEEEKFFQKSNPERLAKLSSRMSSSSTNEKEKKKKDIWFEFVQFFIKAAASPAFNQHLIDRITFDIQQIETKLESENVEEDEEEFLLKKCILLARLLSFVTFLPYRELENQRQSSPTLDQESLTLFHIELRKYQRPSLDLKSFLNNAIARNRLTFSLPWIIEFLSFADTISLQLPAYKETLSLISSIYHNLLTFSKSNKEGINPKNKNFLRFWCGNFFSLPTFPLSMLHQKEVGLQELMLSQGLKKLSAVENEDDEEEKKGPIDRREGIGRRLANIYFSSDFTGMKRILSEGLQQQATPFGENSRHIRPTPASVPSTPKPSDSVESELQRQLESSFFDGNSPSLKRTVDFVSERVASNYVKHLRKLMVELRNELASQLIFGNEAAETCKEKMLKGLKAYVESKVGVGMDVLIGDSLSPPALKLAIQLSGRQTMDKVGNWVHSHIKAEMFPQVELPESTKITPQAQVISKTQPNTIEEFSPIFPTIISLHQLIRCLHSREPLDEIALESILSNSPALSTCSGMISSLVDFGIALLTFSPSLLSSDRQCKLIKLWSPQWNPDCTLLCPRNVLILRESTNPALSWKKLEELMFALLEKGLLKFERLEQDCLRLIREDMRPADSVWASRLIKNLVDSKYSSLSSRDDNGETLQILDWISWLCSEEGNEF